jgi:predicted signal transduction protein with EAL and GGDEF domain
MTPNNGRALIFSREHESKIRQLASLKNYLRRTDLETEVSLYFSADRRCRIWQDRRLRGARAARQPDPRQSRFRPCIFLLRVAKQCTSCTKGALSQ